MSGHDGHGGERGFTLIELLVTMVISLIVLIATLNAFDVFTSNAVQQNRETSANDQVRLTMDRTVRDLRGAAAIVRAANTDLVYSVPEPGGVRTERLCTSGGALYASSAVTVAAPGAPAAACASGSRVAPVTANGDTAFTYDGAASSSTPAAVRNVGLTFSLDASGGEKSGRSRLQASAAVRRATAPVPLSSGAVTVVCSLAGPVINLGVGGALATDGGPLTVSYAVDGGTTIGGGVLSPTAGSPPVTLPKTATNVVATLTDALGIVRATTSNAVGCST